MATLKDHQNAMVDLLANGSAIPASAARLAHALHDVLGLLLERDSGPRRHVGGFVAHTKSYVQLAADLDSVTDCLKYKQWHANELDLELDALKEAYKGLRAELANVTNQRDAYKARCESLEADAFDLEVTRAALKELQDAVALEGICSTNYYFAPATNDASKAVD